MKYLRFDTDCWFTFSFTVCSGDIIRKENFENDQSKKSSENDQSAGHFQSIFSSPEPMAHGYAYSIPVTPAPVRRLSTFSNIFSSKTTGPIKLKFHMERNFVQIVLVTLPRLPQCSYMVKTL